MNTATSNPDNETSELIRKFIEQHPHVVGGGPASLMQRFSCNTRAAALLGMVFFDGVKWDGGALEINEESTLLDQDGNAKITIEDFMRENPAVVAFRTALERALKASNHPEEEADAIVDEAARRMFPEFIKSLEEKAARLVAESKASPLVRGKIPFPIETSILWKIPKSPNLAALNLIMDALAMVQGKPAIDAEERKLIRWCKQIALDLAAKKNGDSASSST